MGNKSTTSLEKEEQQFVEEENVWDISQNGNEREQKAKINKFINSHKIRNEELEILNESQFPIKNDNHNFGKPLSSFVLSHVFEFLPISNYPSILTCCKLYFQIANSTNHWKDRVKNFEEKNSKINFQRTLNFKQKYFIFHKNKFPLISKVEMIKKKKVKTDRYRNILLSEIEFEGNKGMLCSLRYQCYTFPSKNPYSKPSRFINPLKNTFLLGRRKLFANIIGMDSKVKELELDLVLVFSFDENSAFSSLEDLIFDKSIFLFSNKDKINIIIQLLKICREFKNNKFRLPLHRFYYFPKTKNLKFLFIALESYNTNAYGGNLIKDIAVFSKLIFSDISELPIKDERELQIYFKKQVFTATHHSNEVQFNFSEPKEVEINKLIKDFFEKVFELKEKEFPISKIKELVEILSY